MGENMSEPIAAEAGLQGMPSWISARTNGTDTLTSLLAATLQEIPANKSLELASDSTNAVYVVLGGWLVSSKSTQEGQRQIVDFVMPGEVFDTGSATAKHSSTDLVALTNTTVSVIARDVWAGFLQQHPELQNTVNRLLAAGYSRVAERLLRVGKSHAEARIAYAICELCLRSTELGLVNGNDFHLPLTQQVLGDFVGLSSVHVSRTLRRLRRQKIMGTGNHMDIVIHDVDRLAEIAEIDLDDLRAEIIGSV